MKIGIDIDDTICDNFNIILPYICKYYGYNIKDFERALKTNGGIF